MIGRVWAAIAGVLLGAAPVLGNVTDYYKVETVELPDVVAGEIGGLTFTPEGRLVACFHQGGRVYMYDPQKKEWHLFAEGLHEPLGVHAVSERELVVVQRPELTRIRDTDGDGWADVYETISDDYGMSGNYHEFAYGPAVGPDGNYFISLNTASNGAGIYDELRGTFRERGRPGRMYSCVPYRGWVLRIGPDGERTAWAAGFRSPNGVGFDRKGRLFVTDNQGDWVGTSKLFHVQRGEFYGHPSSLVWKDGFEKNPLKVPVRRLDRMRTRAAVLFPHGKMANSPTRPLCDTTGGKFGPFAGQLFIGEMNHRRILRVMLEEVAGVVQGACVPFFDGHGLRRGNNRLAFGPNHALWVGQTARRSGWTGSRGLQRIEWTGKTPMAVEEMHLTEDGFELVFTRPVASDTATKPSAYSVRHYYYEYHRKYGSRRFDERPVEVKGVEVRGKRRVALRLARLKPGYVYELHLDGIRSADGHPLIGDFLCYTVNRLVDGTAPPPQIPATREVARKTPETPTPARVPGVYEAEAGAVYGPRRMSNHDGYTGDGFVDYQNPTGDGVAWRVEVEEGGPRVLVFRYALADGNRPLELRINGETVRKKVAFPSTGSWTAWKTTRVRVELKNGENVVRVEATGSSGPNLDHLRLAEP